MSQSPDHPQTELGRPKWYRRLGGAIRRKCTRGNIGGLVLLAVIGFMGYTLWQMKDQMKALASKQTASADSTKVERSTNQATTRKVSDAPTVGTQPPVEVRVITESASTGTPAETAPGTFPPPAPPPAPQPAMDGSCPPTPPQPTPSEAPTSETTDTTTIVMPAQQPAAPLVVVNNPPAITIPVSINVTGGGSEASAAPRKARTTKYVFVQPAPTAPAPAPQVIVVGGGAAAPINITQTVGGK